MAPARNLGPVLIAGATMQHDAVVEKLDVAFTDAHVEVEFGRGGEAPQLVERRDLRFRHHRIGGGDGAVRVAARAVAGERAPLLRTAPHLLDPNAPTEPC